MHHETSRQVMAQDKYIVVIEPHFDFFRYLKVIRELGYKSLVLTLHPDDCAAGEQKYHDRFEHYEGSRIDELVAYDSFDVKNFLRALAPFRDRIAGVVAGEDGMVPIAAEVGTALGFDCAHPDDARCHHVKSTMKQRLVERGVRTPRFGIAHNFDDALKLWEGFGRDCIVKMVDFAVSLNVYRVRSEEQLLKSWDTIAHNRRGLQVPFPLAKEAILEEYVPGRELTVEGYVQGERIEFLNFSEKITEHNFIIVGHYIPAVISAAEESSLKDIAAQCVRALGVRNSLFHVEVHVRDGVPYVIECAARPPGQRAVEVIEKIYGFDLMGLSIDLATGREVRLKRAQAQRYYAMLALYATQSGRLVSVEGLDELQARGGVEHVFVGVKPGGSVRALDTFQDKYGLLILTDKSPEKLRENAVWARENVRLVVGTPDQEPRPKVTPDEMAIHEGDEAATGALPDWAFDVLRCPNTRAPVSLEGSVLRLGDGKEVGRWERGIVRFPIHDRGSNTKFYREIGGVHFHEHASRPFAMSSLDAHVYHAHLETFCRNDLHGPVVDIGGGDGRNAEFFLARGYKRIIVVDVAVEALLRFRNRVAEHDPESLDRLLLIEADARNLPLGDSCATNVIAIEALSFLNEDYETGLADAARILASNGILVISEHDYEGGLAMKCFYHGLGAMIETSISRELWHGPAEHMKMFTEEELLVFVRRCGLDVKATQGISIFSMILAWMQARSLLSDRDVKQLPAVRKMLADLGREGHMRRCHVIIAGRHG